MSEYATVAESAERTRRIMADLRGRKRGKERERPGITCIYKYGIAFSTEDCRLKTEETVDCRLCNLKLRLRAIA